MCSRKEARAAQRAQDTAALALTQACHGICEHVGQALSKAYPVDGKTPADMTELVRKLG